jgi:two-component system, OmpR family, sensor histidine kinase BaeS
MNPPRCPTPRGRGAGDAPWGPGPWGPGPWGRRPWGPPPWWPHGEPWPPRGRTATEAWRRMRGRFFRRAVLFIVAVVVFTSVVSVIVRWILRGVVPAGGPAGPYGPGPGWGVIAQPVLTAVIVVALLVIFAGPRGYRRMAGPVEDVMAALGRAAAGDLSARVPERGSPEEQTLARAFNIMADRLQREDDRRRALLTDISHELRTPLAVLQGTLEGMLDGIYPRDAEHLALGLEETQTLGRLVEDLRTLATAESARLRLTKAPVDLTVLAQDAVAAFQDQAASAGVTVAQVPDAGPAPVVEADAERLRQVLNNLISNALRYTPRGGTVRVRSYALDAGHAGLAVEDTGTGIAAEDLPHVFDRFYKSKDSRGSGLGLAIAKSLVEAHGGEISAASPSAGRGTSMRIVLPRRDAG